MQWAAIRVGVLGAVLLGCGSQAPGTDAGSEGGTGSGPTSSGTSAGPGTRGSASTSAGPSSTGAGSDASASGGEATASSGATTNGEDDSVYVEPETIVGGACAEERTSVSPPCDGVPMQEYCRLDDPSDVIMATCLAAGRDQCEVMDDCEPGWHACTATDYVARGGRDVVPDLGTGTNEAWLAACVQDLGDTRFRNEPCSYCGEAEYTPVVQWWCDGEVVYEGGMAGSTLGVVASTQCMRVGTNLPANGANWRIAFADGSPPAVVCCLDQL